jgi:hypothetical protein
MTQLTLIDHSGPVDSWGAAGQALGAASPLSEFLGRWRRLPTFARNHSYHAASVRAPGNPALARTLGWLQGKFVVVNPAVDVRLPDDTAAQARTVVRHFRKASGSRHDWLAAALYEPASTTIRHRARVAPHASGVARRVRFVADVAYRLVIVAGRGEPADVAGLGPGEGAARADAAGSGGWPWLRVTLYTPDDDALRQMDADAALVYKRATGRMGPGSLDSYWHLETWERFRERGRLVGHVAPGLVDHVRVGEAVDGWEESARASAEPSYDDFLLGTAGGYSTSRWRNLTPSFDRRSFVPPGYCLVEYRCRVELAVVDVRG